MRALRSSLYMDAYEPPVTTVVLEDSVIDTLESIRHGHLVPGALVIHEIFESSDDIVTATTEAIQRQRANSEQEAHQAMMFYWVVLQWGRVRAGGVLLMDKPAPMSREAYEYALAQLAQHPERPPITIIGLSNDGHTLALSPDGTIKVELLEG